MSLSHRRVNPAVNAVTIVLQEQALVQAAAADARLAQGEDVRPLHGVPVTTKCNTDQIGCPTEHCVQLAQTLVARSNEPVIANAQGRPVFIGRTNSPAYATRFDTDNEVHARTFNPYSNAHTAVQRRCSSGPLLPVWARLGRGRSWQISAGARLLHWSRWP